MAFFLRLLRAKGGARPKPKDKMDQKIEELSSQTAELNVSDENDYNPDTIPFETATFALS